MLKHRKMQYDKAGPRVAEALNKRYFEAYYCSDREEGLKKVLELIPGEHTVSWGGTMTVDELGIVSLPMLLHYTPKFQIGAIISVTLVFLVSAAETIGDTTAVCTGEGR